MKMRILFFIAAISFTTSSHSIIFNSEGIKTSTGSMSWQEIFNLRGTVNALETQVHCLRNALIFTGVGLVATSVYAHIYACRCSKKDTLTIK